MKKKTLQKEELKKNIIEKLKKKRRKTNYFKKTIPKKKKSETNILNFFQKRQPCKKIKNQKIIIEKNPFCLFVCFFLKKKNIYIFLRMKNF